MQRRTCNLVFIIAITLSLFWGMGANAQNTQDEISNEVNAAESAAGPGTESAPAPAPGPATAPDLAPEPEAPAPPPSKNGELPQGDLTTDQGAAPQPPAAQAPSSQGAGNSQVAPADQNAQGNEEIPLESESAPESQSQAAPAESPAPEAQPAPPETVTGGEEAPKTPTKICECRFSTEVPYIERRPNIGGFFGVDYYQFQPTNYQPDFSNNTYSAEYGAGTGLIGIDFGVKWNMALGSLGAEFNVGYFQATNSGDNAKLTVIPITAGLIFALDSLFKEPYVVPYVSGGFYSDIYQESAGGLNVKGNSAFSEYYGLGMMFQLDWMDVEAHDSGYMDYGIENTFLYVEARSYLAAANALPDFSTPLQIGGGIKVEF